MSGFKDQNFIKEFACRTQLNHYRLKFNQSNSENEKKQILLRINDLENIMINRKYDVSNYYEITQLINSLIGLLVFPQQGYYDVLKYNESTIEREMSTLYNYINKGYKKDVYSNTYDEDRKKIYNVLRHMRNSTCHNRMGIKPESANGKEITHICFRDEDKENHQFKLTIDVNDLEKILIEISDFIIKLPL